MDVSKCVLRWREKRGSIDKRRLQKVDFHLYLCETVSVSSLRREWAGRDENSQIPFCFVILAKQVLIIQGMEKQIVCQHKSTSLKFSLFYEF